MPNTPSTKLPTYLPTLAEVRALASANSRTAPTGLRNKALVLVLASTGLRIGEALALRPSDYRRQDATLRVQSGKGGKHRVARVAMPEAVDALEHWLDARKGLGISGHRPVFCTLKGGAIKQQYVRLLLPRLARRAGIEGRIHAHGLRHFFAATLATNGAPMLHVQRALGHSSLQTTAFYLSRIAPEETYAATTAAFERAMRVSKTE